MSTPNSAPLPSSFDGNDDFYNENWVQKLGRRIREEPLIPLGCGLTVWAIVGASRSMRKGDHHKTNLYFRRRLYAQAFTIATLCVGNLYWQKDRGKRREYEKLKAQKEAQEKREKWVRELEMRDEEEKAFKARLARQVRGAEEKAKGVTEAVREKVEEAKEKVVGGDKK